MNKFITAPSAKKFLIAFVIGVLGGFAAIRLNNTQTIVRKITKST